MGEWRMESIRERGTSSSSHEGFYDAVRFYVQDEIEPDRGKFMTAASTRLFLTVTTAVTIGAFALPQPADAGRGRLRERIQDRLEQRRAEPRTNGAISGPGDYRYTVRHGGRERVYLVHVPKTYRANTPMPVVIAMHGGGGSASYMAKDENYRLISKSDEAGFIAVFPNGTGALPSGALATWNAGICCGKARDNNIDDVGFIRTMMARLNTQVSVDRRRVFATGMSNGGMMSYRLACEMPDMIRGIMAVAGTDGTKTCNPRSPVPVLHAHARDDDHVLFEGGKGPAARDPGKEADYVSVPDTISKWVGLNNAVPQPRRVLSVAGAYCDLYAAGPRGAPVKLCVTQTGGHSWPGGGALRGKQPSKAIDANDLMWDFFSRL
jgi:polyhydroxybutyrate depolymerase